MPHKSNIKWDVSPVFPSFPGPLKQIAAMKTLFVGISFIAIAAIIGWYGAQLAKEGWEKIRGDTPANNIARNNQHQVNINSPGSFQIQSDKTTVQFTTIKIIENADKFFNERIDNINDPRIQDGGKVSVYADIKDGPILDIGSKNSLDRNRILIELENQKHLILSLFDHHGKKYQLQSLFSNAPGGGKIECVWSSKYGFILLKYNGEILSKTTLSDLSIFIDTRQQRVIHVASSLDDRSAFGNFKNLEIYAAKDLGTPK